MIGLPVLGANLSNGPTEGKVLINLVSSVYGIALLIYWATALVLSFLLVTVLKMYFKKRYRLEGYGVFGLIYLPYVFWISQKLDNWFSISYFVFQTVLISFVYDLVFRRFFIKEASST